MERSHFFERSVRKLNLIYKKDGDSSSFSRVSATCPYGPLESIENEECISRITKRMGSGLRAIVQKHKSKPLSNGKTISDAGRLTISRIDTIQTFYGLALRENKGDCQKMAKAILKHRSTRRIHVTKTVPEGRARDVVLIRT